MTGDCPGGWISVLSFQPCARARARRGLSFGQVGRLLQQARAVRPDEIAALPRHHQQAPATSDARVLDVRQDGIAGQFDRADHQPGEAAVRPMQWHCERRHRPLSIRCQGGLWNIEAVRLAHRLEDAVLRHVVAAPLRQGGGVGQHAAGGVDDQQVVEDAAQLGMGIEPGLAFLGAGRRGGVIGGGGQAVDGIGQMRLQRTGRLRDGLFEAAVDLPARIVIDRRDRHRDQSHERKQGGADHPGQQAEQQAAWSGGGLEGRHVAAL